MFRFLLFVLNYCLQKKNLCHKILLNRTKIVNLVLPFLERIIIFIKSNLRSFGLLGHPELQLIFPFLAVSFFSLLRVILQTTFLWYFAFNELIMLIDCVFDVELGGREKNLTVFNLKVDDRLIVDH